ncbi:MAG: hypothetical protein JWP63_2413 [Candidatus Solibacter sp.]|jgi:Uma2 family endonuclease|nr:hypothetical protein [Candidatus Solibacter sp.]
MGSTTTRLTFEEFERLPEQPGKRELLKGELIELPPAEEKHNRIAHRLCRRLEDSLREAHCIREALELGDARMELGYQLSGNGWVQPDVSVTHALQALDKYFIDAPAIAIEVVSDGNSAEDLAFKTDLYFEYGAREVWLVYPKTRQIVVYTAGIARIIRVNESLTTPLLPNFAMSVAEILGE